MKVLLLWLQLTAIFYILPVFAPLYANNIQLNFPAHAEKPVSLVLKYGTKEEPAFNGNLDEKGQLTIELSEQYIQYSGMATLKIGNDIQTNFIINNENPVLRNEGGQFDETMIFFENSPENDSLQRWFPANTIRKEKLVYSSQLIRFYKEADPLYLSLEKELESLKKKQGEFDNILRTSNLYAAKFMQLHSFYDNEVNALVYMDSVQMSVVRKFVIEDLDINALYTSGLWFKTLNGLLAMYDTNAPFHKDFISDMTQLLKKSKDDRTYTTLAENLFEICEAMAWQDLGDQLAYFVMNDDRIQNPQGKLKLLLGTYKIRKGNPAPELVMDGIRRDGARPISTQIAQNTIVIFYENGCISCQTELENFIINYPKLQELNIEVITISADTEKEMYHKLADRFPWEQKYCDFKGLQGDNFQNYGIIATPTIFIIDKEGIIQGRYARFKDMEF